MKTFLQTTLRRLLVCQSPFELLPFDAQETDNTDSTTAIRWLGPTTIAGDRRTALLCHPNSSVSFRINPVRGARVETGCCMLPDVWGKNAAGVEFELSIRTAAGGWAQSVRRVVNPSGCRRDRRWRPLRIWLPDQLDPSETVLVTLTTRVPSKEALGYAWAVWGGPTLSWLRPAREVRRAFRAMLREIQQRGFRPMLRRLHTAAELDERPLEYARWVERHTPTKSDLARMAADVTTLPYKPLLSIVTPLYNTEARWLRPFFDSITRQIYPRWELCIGDDASSSPETLAAIAERANDSRIKVHRLDRNSGISAASNAALASATGEFVVMMDSDDEIPPEALYEVVRYLNAHPDADFIYSDEDKLDLAGNRCEPYFKPDWSPELFHSYMYTNHLMVLRRSLVDELGGFRDAYTGSQDYDLVLRVMARTTRIQHIPKVLYHWRKIPGSAAAQAGAKPYPEVAGRRALEDHLHERGLEADVISGPASGLYRVRYRIQEHPLVTIVIPTADRSGEFGGRTVAFLPNCLRSIVDKTSYDNYEILVVDDGRLSDPTRDLLAVVSHRRVSYSREGPFNFASKINFAVAHARGEHVVLFNDDLEVIGAEWLTAMLEYSQQPEIGAVGAKLLFPDGRIQHIGILLGVCGVAAHAFHSHPGSTLGYAGSAVVARNYSAVSGACMMTRRKTFESVGGFDERFATDFNDVDYCLRLRRAGYRVVYTPYAQLYHLESGSLGLRTAERTAIEEIRKTWGHTLDHDPYYNPNLSCDFPDYRL